MSNFWMIGCSSISYFQKKKRASCLYHVHVSLPILEKANWNLENHDRVRASVNSFLSNSCGGPIHNYPALTASHFGLLVTCYAIVLSLILNEGHDNTFSTFDALYYPRLMLYIRYKHYNMVITLHNDHDSRN